MWFSYSISLQHQNNQNANIEQCPLLFPFLFSLFKRKINIFNHKDFPKALGVKL